MSRCEIFDKTVNFGKKVSITRSHVSRRSNHMQKPNVKKIRVNLNGV